MPTSELVRFVLSPDDIVTPDLRCKLPGRGLWLCADRHTITEAVKKKLFARGFRQKALANSELPDIIHKLSRNEALHILSLANKAGLVITGYEKIKRALAKGDVKWLLHAIEASRNGSDKLDRYFAPRDAEHLEAHDPQPIGAVLEPLFTGDELSLALGRSNVIHMGLKQGAMARRLPPALKRLAAFETHKHQEVNADHDLKEQEQGLSEQKRPD